ncbi:MAG TPA: RIP metalloprotease RseP [Longimicrobiaceae bacterium]|nr:RIP metalloprotease RseP [Longimicrobiaceae bacterium]
MLITVVAFLVVIGVLVFVHELGHLLAAKAVDIECPRFSLGFGPRLFGFQWGETEYVVSALPLGGYVRMAGMEETAALEGGEEPDREPSDRDFDAKPLWARIIVVIAGVVMNFLFAIAAIAAVGLAFGEPYNPETRVAVEAQPGGVVAAPLAAVPLGARVTAVGSREVSSWEDVHDALASAPAGPLTIHFAATPDVRLDLPRDDSARTALLAPIQPYIAPVISQVSPSSPASHGGIEPGDRILSADGRPIRAWGEFVDVVRAHPDRDLPLTIERGGQPLSLTVRPERQMEENDRGVKVPVGLLGVAPEVPTAHRPIGLGQALHDGWSYTWGTAHDIVTLLGGLFTGAASPRSLGGPLTIAQISGQAARLGTDALLTFMAFLSVNLAVLNLLPIPVLDGGQLLLLLIEGIRGRPLSIEQRLRLAHVGLILVAGIMLWAITNEVLRFFGV